MSSSTFEVTETENETEKEISFGLEACEENGIDLSAQVDGEIQKDHTYTKDPDVSDEDEEKTEDSQEEESEKTDAPSEKRTTRNLKSSKSVKKPNPKNAKPKKEASPKKEAPAPKKGKAKKEVLTEESNKSDDNAKPEKSDEKNDVEDQSKSSKRGKKRKVEEKENVIDRSIVEEVQNINEGDTTTETSSESPAKKRNAAVEKSKPKKTPKSAPTVEDGEDNQNLPKGWVRKVVVRKSGKTAGQIDIYIYSPDGIKFRSRPDIAAYLARTKSNLKLEDFSFSKKSVAEDSTVKTAPKKEKPAPVPKPKNTPEKKKIQTPAASPKKGSKLLVKLNFSPKSKKGKNAKKTADKPTKQTKSSVKKGKASSSSSKSNKKKTA